ncbi:methyl-accepting chemotaxis protein [Paraburkholderia bannensis]|nr:methyl-accepting chemotaxis protein [Paraburkholderia bannensis]RQM47144.1 methyl-accepting chemotaxis protein [Paraburkholderia bannensis]
MRPISISLRAKTLLVVSAVVTAGFAICITVISIRSAETQRSHAITSAKELAETNAAGVAEQLSSTFDTLSDASLAMIAMKKNGLANRVAADDILKSVLAAHDSYLGLGTVWEPNAFDGKDADFINTRESDKTGRYLTYWNRTSGNIAAEPCTDYDAPGLDGEYYQKPHRTGHSSATEPHSAMAGGKQVMLTTLSVPIIDAGRVVGVTLADLALSKLEETIGKIHPYKTGYATLISSQGKVLASGGANQDASTLSQETLTAIATVRESGLASVSTTDNTTLGDAVQVIVPVPIAASGQTWFLSITIPESQIMAGVHQTQIVAVLIGLACVLVVSTALLLSINKLVLSPLGGEPQYAVELASSVGEGNLADTPTLRAAAASSVMGMLVSMRERLKDVVSDVRQNADSVAVASSEIAQGSLELSARTEQQAAALQQTSAAMEELTITVRANADNAREASSLALNATKIARTGGKMVRDVVSTMGEINAGSRKVSDIIGVIESIAFQTNILALNAAVEAARAGEQGKGFAVVAGEVRTLAQRAAASARDVKELVQASVSAVEKGHEQVNQAGDTVAVVVDEIEKVNALVQGIAAASHEQSQGLEQIVAAVGEMDDATQRNAALVEESTAAAEALRHQAITLQSTVGIFRTE